MTKKKVAFSFLIFGLLLVYFLLLSNILASPITLRGIIISDCKILTNEGKTYKIFNPEKPFSIPDNIGKKVEVLGVVDDVEGEIGITLNSLKILIDLSNARRS